jgi:hypothetical protein
MDGITATCYLAVTILVTALMPRKNEGWAWDIGVAIACGAWPLTCLVCLFKTMGSRH